MPRWCRAPWRSRRPPSRRYCRHRRRRRSRRAAGGRLARGGLTGRGRVSARLAVTADLAFEGLGIDPAGVEKGFDLVLAAREVQRRRLVPRHLIRERRLLRYRLPDRGVMGDIETDAGDALLGRDPGHEALHDMFKAAAGKAQIHTGVLLQLVHVGGEGDVGIARAGAGGGVADARHLNGVGLGNAEDQPRRHAALIGGIVELAELPFEIALGGSGGIGARQGQDRGGQRHRQQRLHAEPHRLLPLIQGVAEGLALTLGQIRDVGNAPRPDGRKAHAKWHGPGGGDRRRSWPRAGGGA